MDEKKYARELKRLKKFKELDEHERILWARMFASSPEERWQMNQNYLRSLGLLKPSKKKKFLT